MPEEIPQIPGRATFDEAVERLRKLLRSLLRPDALVWVTPFQVIRGSSHLYIFRPDLSDESEGTARRMFDLAARDCVAVRVGAVASSKTTTFAMVWPIQELADGEAMFIHDSVKTDAPDENPAVTEVRSRLWWWVIESHHARLRRRRR